MLRKVNFGAGPAVLPEAVLQKFCEDLIDFEGSGVGVGELSHRTDLFERGILETANEGLYALSGYSRVDWQVLWMSGGGTGQFAAIPLNLPGRAVYLITGVWSEKAAEEAKRILGAQQVICIDLRAIDQNGLNTLKDVQEELKNYMSVDTVELSYVYYCDNETVDGIELPDPNYFQNRFPDTLQVPFICDSSSNFMSRPLPQSSGPTALIFAGVQKNLGAAGVTAVLVKRTLLNQMHLQVNPSCPSIFNYSLMAKHNSLLNTPPVMAIHMCNLMLKHLQRRFASLQEINQFSRRKSGKLYAALEESKGGYACLVADGFRSRMNVVFKEQEVESTKANLLERANQAGLIQLKGHRSVGGLRASLYNALEEYEVDKLIELL